MNLIDDWKQSWKYLSVQLHLIWGVMMTVFISLPQAQQSTLISALGFDGEKILTLFVFFAQVNAGVAAATLTARITTFPWESNPKNTPTTTST